MPMIRFNTPKYAWTPGQRATGGLPNIHNKHIFVAFSSLFVYLLTVQSIYPFTHISLENTIIYLFFFFLCLDSCVGS